VVISHQIIPRLPLSTDPTRPSVHPSFLTVRKFLMVFNLCYSQRAFDAKIGVESESALKAQIGVGFLNRRWII